MTSMKIGALVLSLIVVGGWGGTWFSLSGDDGTYAPLTLTGVDNIEVKTHHWLDKYANSDLFSRDRGPLGVGKSTQPELTDDKVAVSLSAEDIAKQQAVSKQWKLVAIIKEEKAEALIEMADASFMTLVEGDELPDGRTIDKIGTRQIWLADKNATALTQVELFRFE